MSIGHNPKIVKDGLVLALDAASKKNALSTVEVLVVAGGGAGGGGLGGGGGGGGVIYMPGALITPGTAYNVIVGAGGASTTYPTPSTNGGNSSAFGAEAAGGGGSGSYSAGIGYSGGSGGGAAATQSILNQGGSSGGSSLGSNTGIIYGNRGGNQLNSRLGTPTAAAGGGGAGSAAADVNCNIVLSIPGTEQSRGGDGIPNSILGTLYYWSGGGGGGAYYNGYAGNGGLGGGGGGSCTAGSGPSSGGASALNSGADAAVNANGGNGGANTGGGGGGGSWQTTSGGAGGSGIVIVQYKGSQRATGGTVTFINGYTIHTFTTSGTFTPNGTPGTGTILTDFSKNGNSTTLINGTTYNSSNGGFLAFDGIDDHGDTGKTAAQLGIYDAQYTMIAFFRVPNLSGDKMVFGTDQAAGRSGMHHGVRDNAFYFGHYGADATGGSVVANTWYHGAWVWTTASPTARVYINGILTASSGAGSFIGTSNILLARSFVRHHNMDIAQTAIYNRALTEAEIKQNFNALKGRFGL